MTTLMVSAVLVGATPAAAADPHVIPRDPVAIDDIDALLEIYGPPEPRRSADPTADARCGSAAIDPVPDGQPIVVSMPPARGFTVGAIPSSWWRSPPVTDPTWLLQFQGLMWMRPLARRAAMDGQQQSLAAIVGQAVRFHQQNPDPNANRYGWDEGTALRRLETMNCLYALTGAASLRTGMAADAKVLLGWRYYGPPNHPVHNHGLMANLQLVRAGDLLGMPAWKSTAVNRMSKEAPLAFSRLGTSYEQSSMYQNVNAGLWAQGANVLHQSPGTESASTAIDATVAKARSVYQWMTEPDGAIVQVGDSDQQAGSIGSLTTPRVFRDGQTGWIIGRWSWTDPTTTYYTVRYGPGRRAHGHHDRAGGVTWSSRGVRVLVGPGRFSYDLTDRYNAYQLSPKGQNVAIPDKRKVTNAGGSVSAYVVQAPAHAWTIKDRMFGVDHVRNVNVNRDLPAMRVSDNFPAVTLWRQHWHLDPAWKHVSGSVNGTRLVFAHPSGRRVTITTTGRISSFVQGITRPPAGWHFPRFGSRVWAYEIVIRSYGRACTTTFRLS
ncbi:hypothetical protein OHA21_14475 [Actinoplanes sp. NBC_00393]|uniref:hypothetical protein n=1 Tax=Actinoplanes sp. NBC_00393 TaxID=2975953 RepID=UPI002E1DDBD1